MVSDEQLKPMDAGTPAGLCELVTCQLPTAWGVFTMYALAASSDGHEHVALSMGRIDDVEPGLARIHSEYLSGDISNSSPYCSVMAPRSCARPPRVATF
jgi:GTP cyclohydrolase II